MARRKVSRVKTEDHDRGRQGESLRHGDQHEQGDERVLLRRERSVAEQALQDERRRERDKPWKRYTSAAILSGRTKLSAAAASQVHPWTNRNQKPPRFATRLSSRSQSVVLAPPARTPSARPPTSWTSIRHAWTPHRRAN